MDEKTCITGTLCACMEDDNKMQETAKKIIKNLFIKYSL
jgi:hypothetical protein